MNEKHGPRFIDRAGQRCGKLTVISFHSKTKWGSKWTCRCDCGNEVVALAGNLKPNHTTSCGCVQAAITTARNLTHGLSRTKEYEAWAGAKARTVCSTNKRYVHYGERGIKMCDRWLNSFENFFADMGKCPPDKTSLGRIGNDGDYCPENCRWENQVQQMNNTRRNHSIEHLGKVMTIAQWGRELNCDPIKICAYIHQGYSFEEAVKKNLPWVVAS